MTFLPTSSEPGARTRGPTANPSTYTDTTNEASRVLELPNSAMSAGTPAASIEDANWVMNVSVLTIPTLVNLARPLKLTGFSGS